MSVEALTPTNPRSAFPPRAERPPLRYPRPGDADYSPQWDVQVMRQYGGQCVVWSGNRIVAADVDPKVARAKAVELGVTSEYELIPLFICKPEEAHLPW